MKQTDVNTIAIIMVFIVLLFNDTIVFEYIVVFLIIYVILLWSTIISPVPPPITLRFDFTEIEHVIDENFKNMLIERIKTDEKIKHVTIRIDYYTKTLLMDIHLKEAYSNSDAEVISQYAKEKFFQAIKNST